MKRFQSSRVGPFSLLTDYCNGLDKTHVGLHASTSIPHKILPMASNGPALPVENLTNDLQRAHHSSNYNTGGLQWAQYNLRGDHTTDGLTVILEKC